MTEPLQSNQMKYSPFKEMLLCRVREFLREKEAVFWVFVFPMLMTLTLGIAFRDKQIEEIIIDVQAGNGAAQLKERLTGPTHLKININNESEAQNRLRTGKTALVVRSDTTHPSGVSFLYDETRPDGYMAKTVVENQLYRPKTATEIPVEKFDQPGGRYIDFLVPGLLGMGLMAGGLFGLGFVSVDLRIRKLLKRFLATPMKKSQFLLSLMASRFIFMVPEILVLLGFSYLIFGVRIFGSIWLVVLLIVLGAFTFSGIGLLVGSRAKTLEAASGLMNLVMLPMWVLSGIFFSAARFPEAMQPYIKLLPLTPLIDALRLVMNEGKGLMDVIPQMITVVVWGLVCFVVGLKIFRWQ